MRPAGHKRIIRHFATISIISLLCLGPVYSQAPEKVVLQLKWKHQFQFAGYYAARLMGYYEAEGLRVEFVEGKDVDTTARVVSGEADFGVALSDLVLSFAGGEPVVALATIFQHSPLVLIRREDEAAGSVHDVNETRVMLEAHSEELEAYLSEMGVPTQELIRVPYQDPIESLFEDKVDVISGYLTDEPFHLRQQGLAFHISSPRSVGIDFYGDTLFTSMKMLQEKPEVVEKFRRASLLGWAYALEHPRILVDYILETWPEGNSEEALLYEAEHIQKLVRNDLVEIGYMHPGRWQHIADVYSSLNILDADVNLYPFLYQIRPPFPWSKFLMVTLPLGTLFLISILFAVKQRKLRYKQKKTLEKLKVLERKLSTLVMNLPGLAYRCHNDGGDWMMEYVSSGALELTGYSPEQLMGRKGMVFGDLIHPADAPGVIKQIRAATGKRERFRLQYRIRHKDGGYRWVWEQGILVEDGEEGGMLEGFICDIHDQKRLEEEKKEDFEKLQKLMNEIKVLRGIIPICSSCKKIRNDEGGWDQMEAYIRAHSEANFSHGICPDCMHMLYPDLTDK